MTRGNLALICSGQSPDDTSKAVNEPSQVHRDVQNRTKDRAKYLSDERAEASKTSFLKEELESYRRQKQDALEDGASKPRIRWLNKQIDDLEDKLEERTPPKESKQLVEVTR